VEQEDIQVCGVMNLLCKQSSSLFFPALTLSRKPAKFIPFQLTASIFQLPAAAAAVIKSRIKSNKINRNKHCSARPLQQQQQQQQEE